MLALGRAAGTAPSHEHTWLSLDHRERRAVVDLARRRHWCPDPLIDDDHHCEDALALHERMDAVADFHLRRRLGRGTVHADVAAPASGCRRQSGLLNPDGPQPDVDPGRVDVAIVPA